MQGNKFQEKLLRKKKAEFFFPSKSYVQFYFYSFEVLTLTDGFIERYIVNDKKSIDIR